MSNLNNRSYFFDKGIRFECRQCGACCTGSPGTIYVDKSEVSAIAKFLKIPVVNLKEKYLYPFKNSYSIREHSERQGPQPNGATAPVSKNNFCKKNTILQVCSTDGRCFFYEDGCRIYPVRPGQCSSYPFWFINLRSEKKWHSVSEECRGIGQGRLYSKKKILEIVQTTFPWIMNSVFGTSKND